MNVDLDKLNVMCTVLSTEPTNIAIAIRYGCGNEGCTWLLNVKLEDVYNRIRQPLNATKLTYFHKYSG